MIDRSRSSFGVACPLGYSVPMVIEQTSRGERGYDIFIAAQAGVSRITQKISELED